MEFGASAAIYKDLIGDKACLIARGLSEQLIKNLSVEQDRFNAACDKLDAYGIPDAINHSDFQVNNMMITKDDNMLAIIDWGELSIGNPLLSIESCLYNFSARFGLVRDSAEFRMIKAKSLRYWCDDQNIDVISDLIGQIGPIYYIVTLLELRRLVGDSNVIGHGKIKYALEAFVAND